MNAEGDCWDIDLINDIFLPRDATLILKTLIIPLFGDEWFWNKDIRG